MYLNNYLFKNPKIPTYDEVSTDLKMLRSITQQKDHRIGGGATILPSVIVGDGSLLTCSAPAKAVVTVGPCKVIRCLQLHIYVLSDV